MSEGRSMSEPKYFGSSDASNSVEAESHPFWSTVGELYFPGFSERSASAVDDQTGDSDKVTSSQAEEDEDEETDIEKKDPIEEINKNHSDYAEQERVIKGENVKTLGLVVPESVSDGQAERRIPESVASDRGDRPKVVVGRKDGKVTSVTLNGERVVEAQYTGDNLTSVDVNYDKNDALGIGKYKFECNNNQWTLTSTDKNGNKVSEPVHNVRVGQNGSVSYDVHHEDNVQTLTRGPDGSYRISGPKRIGG